MSTDNNNLEWANTVKRQYAKAGLGVRLAPGARPAVVVVDLIYGFTDPSFPAGSKLDDVVGATRRLLDHARANKVPVIFTTIAFAPERLASTVWLRKMPAMNGLLEGTHWVAVDERLARQPSEPIITKRAASAFGGTDLQALLTGLGVDHIIVCGATTSGCVRATAVDGCMLGWPVFVPVECVGDRAAGPHHANLFDIDAKYGDVITLEEACALVAAKNKNGGKT